LQYTDGRQFEVGVMKSMYTTGFSHSTEARDQMVGAILAQLQAN
jgi:hypothetical protein